MLESCSAHVWDLAIVRFGPLDRALRPRQVPDSDHAPRMAKLKRPELAAEAARLNLEMLARLGGELRDGSAFGGV